MMATFALGLAGTNAQQAMGTQRHNELTLAGLRPGKSKLPKDGKIPGFRGPTMSDDTGVYWSAPCYGDRLQVQENTSRIVETVTVSLFGARLLGECKGGNETALRRELRSGRGVGLGDACARVTELYGEPESRSPSVRGSLKLELLFYSFDWAGEDVPQSMEVSCDPASGRVVEITLAASTL
jgi:hypothetical protein